MLSEINNRAFGPAEALAVRCASEADRLAAKRIVIGLMVALSHLQPGDVLGLAASYAAERGEPLAAVLARWSESAGGLLAGLRERRAIVQAGLAELSGRLGVLDAACRARLSTGDGALAALDRMESAIDLRRRQPGSGVDGATLHAAGVPMSLVEAAMVERREQDAAEAECLTRDRAGWLMERAVLREYVSDPLRDRTRLGKLLSFVLGEMPWPAGPVDLTGAA